MVGCQVRYHNLLGQSMQHILHISHDMELVSHIVNLKNMLNTKTKESHQDNFKILFALKINTK